MPGSRVVHVIAAHADRKSAVVEWEFVERVGYPRICDNRIKVRNRSPIGGPGVASIHVGDVRVVEHFLVGNGQARDAKAGRELRTPDGIEAKLPAEEVWIMTTDAELIQDESARVELDAMLVAEIKGQLGRRAFGVVVRVEDNMGEYKWHLHFAEGKGRAAAGIVHWRPLGIRQIDIDEF